MTTLSVNVNKIATLRNARGGDLPNVRQVCVDLGKWGADGITVHPRPDERHIRYQDVLEIASCIQAEHGHMEFNIEGYPNSRYMQLIEAVRPTQATLVPDPPNVLTSDTGWAAATHKDFLKDIVQQIHAWGVRTSVFLNPIPDLLPHVAHTKTDRIELYTGSYAHAYATDKKAAITPYLHTAKEAQALGIGVNAGHDLNLHNLSYFIKTIPFTQEVSIGHALITDALYYGLENTLQLYKRTLHN